MLAIRELLKDVEAVVASGDFLELKTKFNASKDQKIGVIEDPELKALCTIDECRRKAADEAARQGIANSLDQLKRQIVSDVPLGEIAADDGALAAAIAKLERARLESWVAHYVLRLELQKVFPGVEKVALCEGWVVVTRRSDLSEGPSLDFLRSFFGADDNPDCPVHGKPAKEAQAAGSKA